MAKGETAEQSDVRVAWLRTYGWGAAGRDGLAGLNVALLAFPQGMAYATIAGLPLHYGIIGSGLAAIIGPLISGSRHTVLGPTNATAVLLYASLMGLGVVEAESKPEAVAVILLLTGVFLILGALLRIANLIQYVSRSVTAGYITAAAIYIILNQTRHALGFQFAGAEAASFASIIWQTLEGLSRVHWPSLLISLLTVAIYLTIKRWLRFLPAVASSLLVAALVATPLNAWLAANGLQELRTLAAIELTDWRLVLPPLTPEPYGQFAMAALVIAFLSILEGSSIGKSLAAKAGEKLNTNREMLGMGVANLGCALLQGMPASGSLTRSQLNANSGASTPLASVYSGILCLLGLLLIGPMTRYIPVSALGTLVIIIGISLINTHVIKVVWNSTRSDRTVFCATFVAALLVRLDFAIILGTLTSILLFLRKAAQPQVIEYDTAGETLDPQAMDGPAPELSIIHVSGDLFFGAAELFRDQLRQVCERPHLKIIVLKMRYAYHLDATSILALEELVRYLQANGRHLLISELRTDSLAIVRNSGLADLIGEDHLFADDPSNSTLATATALRYAMRLLDGREAHIRIFLGKAGQ